MWPGQRWICRLNDSLARWNSAGSSCGPAGRQATKMRLLRIDHLSVGAGVTWSTAGLRSNSRARSGARGAVIRVIRAHGTSDTPSPCSSHGEKALQPEDVRSKPPWRQTPRAVAPESGGRATGTHPEETPPDVTRPCTGLPRSDPRSRRGRRAGCRGCSTSPPTSARTGARPGP